MTEPEPMLAPRVPGFVTSPSLPSPDAVQFAGSFVECFHFYGQRRRASRAAYMAPPTRHASCLAALFHLAQGEAVLGLNSLDSKVRQNGGEEGGGFQVGDFPTLKRATTHRARLGYVAIPAERLVEQVDGLRLHLSNADTFGVDRLCRITSDAHSVCRLTDPDCPIGVYDSSEVCE